jgi:hypothetical protein
VDALLGDWTVLFGDVAGAFAGDGARPDAGRDYGSHRDSSHHRLDVFLGYRAEFVALQVWVFKPFFDALSDPQIGKDPRRRCFCGAVGWC